VYSNYVDRDQRVTAKPCHQLHEWTNCVALRGVVKMISMLYSAFVRSHTTSREEAVVMGKSRDVVTAGKKSKRRKLNEDVERPRNRAVKRCNAKFAKATTRTLTLSSCNCDKTVANAERSQDGCRHRCRGWFSSSWPQSDDLTDKCNEFTPDADQSRLDFHEMLTKRTCSQLIELSLECSAAAKWSELKRLRQEDAETLLSSPVGILWRGTVKPLVKPSQATSVGSTYSSLLAV